VDERTMLSTKDQLKKTKELINTVEQLEDGGGSAELKRKPS
jgi:hypothetical protein